MSNLSSRWRVLLLIALGALAAWLWASAPGLAAQAQLALGPPPTPTAGPPRQAGWFNSASPTAPQGLHTTAAFPGIGGGGPPPPDVDVRVIVAPDGGAWTTNSGYIQAGRPNPKLWDDAIWVRAYPEENPPPAQYALTGPDGRTRPLAEEFGVWSYFIDSADPEGSYTLTIRTRARTFTSETLVRHYDGPRIVLNGNARQGETLDLSAGTPIEVTYLGFAPQERVEVGLYRRPGGNEQVILIDTWQFTADVNGNYNEILNVPTNAPLDQYFLHACTLGACGPAYMLGHFEYIGAVLRSFRLTEAPFAVEPFDLWWVPGCDPTRPVMAMLWPGQSACDAGVETRDIDWLADELRTLGLLGANEWLVAVPLGGTANQGLVIRSRTNARLGWIRIGGGTPGSVRRISYSAPERQIGPRCWLFTDMRWNCSGELEINVDRPGSDYRSFELPGAQPELCQQACIAEEQCQAFTYVKPGVQGTAAYCWLKSAVPSSVASDCCVSGVRK